MSDGSQTEVSNVKETALGGKEFSGSIESKDPLAPNLTPAPEGVPEKFWDPVEGKLRSDDLIKSYQSLEAMLGKGKDEDDDSDDDEGKSKDETDEDKSKDETDDGKDKDETGEENDEDKSKEKSDDETEVSKADFAEALTNAQKVYAETGDLPEESRKPFLDAGFTNQQIDLYLAGVKATETALETAAHKAAGGADAYAAAVKWAAEGGLTEKQILAFNAQTGDVETIGSAVAGLMSAFKEANPGEGKLLDIKGGANHGDVYDSMDEFQQDLSNADRIRDKVARKKAIEKLRRSREAGTIAHSNRRQPFGG